MEFKDLSPSPAALMCALRDVGYSLESAVSDIIDNSIAAQSKNIHVRFSWNNGAPWLAIIDDGIGMSESKFEEAMQLGGVSPWSTRSATDLGRFGMGMKTSSLSQCNCLKVITRASNHLHGGEWNIERLKDSHDKRWLMGVLDEQAINANPTLAELKNAYLIKNSGTIVLWENLDRLGDHEINSKENYFNSRMTDTREHISLHFHRFISPTNAGQSKVNFLMNGIQLVAFNPFHPNSSELPRETINIGKNSIIVQPYVLPHHSKISKEEYDRYAGKEGYLHNQGFYIYRNCRLIIRGSWFRLLKKDELNKLLRVRIDIPNSLDFLWKIDIKKSNAFPPEIIREELKKIINKIEDRGRKVYRNRGHQSISSLTDPFWKRRTINSNQIIYEINKTHPLVQQLRAEIPAKTLRNFDNLLRLFESSFPRDPYYHDFADNPELMETPKIEEDALRETMFECLAFLLKRSNSDFSYKDILLIEPFNKNPEIARQLWDDMKGHKNNEL